MKIADKEGSERIYNKLVTLRPNKDIPGAQQGKSKGAQGVWCVRSSPSPNSEAMGCYLYTTGAPETVGISSTPIPGHTIGALRNPGNLSVVMGEQSRIKTGLQLVCQG